MKSICLSVVVALAVSSLGCSTHEVWQVTRYAHPNPLVGQTELGVTPLDFADLKVGEETESEYVARKGGDFRVKWRDDKAVMKALFEQKLRDRASYRGIRFVDVGDAPFVVHPRVTFLQRGYFGGAVRQRARLKAVVDITTADGRLIDQIVVTEIVENVEDDRLNITAGARMRRLAEKLGDHTAQYVAARVAG
ncbi:MAG: hypothetical protein JRI23_04760 [Deltaproteobacteria bacterium]|nr:hypothetical protein [Deltaproteobacteria bacterium]MBW2530860.1 hypothetical protein [Deltaproteobacteria bacterium]